MGEDNDVHMWRPTWSAPPGSKTLTNRRHEHSRRWRLARQHGNLFLAHQAAPLLAHRWLSTSGAMRSRSSLVACEVEKK